MISLDRHTMFFARQMSGKVLAQAVKEDSRILDGKPSIGRTCPICGSQHTDSGYGRACRKCWLAVGSTTD
jgi:hypothetical protein